MTKYRCRVCHWIYDPEKGDPGREIKPGIPFEDLPDDYVCPMCQALKEEFDRIDNE